MYSKSASIFLYSFSNFEACGLFFLLLIHAHVYNWNIEERWIKVSLMDVMSTLGAVTAIKFLGYNQDNLCAYTMILCTLVLNKCNYTVYTEDTKPFFLHFLLGILFSSCRLLVFFNGYIILLLTFIILITYKSVLLCKFKQVRIHQVLKIYY